MIGASSAGCYRCVGARVRTLAGCWIAESCDDTENVIASVLPQRGDWDCWVTTVSNWRRSTLRIDKRMRGTAWQKVMMKG